MDKKSYNIFKRIQACLRVGERVSPSELVFYNKYLKSINK